MKKGSRKILVTGVAGFIGSNFINYAVKKYPQCSFIGLDSLTGIADKKNITVLGEKNFTFYRGDIRDRLELKKIFHEEAPTDIIHFAAETHVDFSIRNPLVFSETNVTGTHNLLYLSLKHKINRFHFISTDEVYGALSKHDAPLTELAPLAPNNPYSASKAAAELFVRSYRETFGLNTIITRSSNNYGPRQDKTKLIPLFINKLLAGEKVPLYGKGEQVRDWLYVEDCVRAIDLVFHKGEAGEIYNIGGGNEHQNLEVVQKLLKLAKRSPKYIEYVPDRLGHDFRYALNSDKLKKLGWNPSTSFDEGLKKTFLEISRRK